MTRHFSSGLVILISLYAALAVTATPAFAEFEANQPNTTQGPFQLATGTTAVFSTGGLSLECSGLVNGAWHIQTKFSKVVVSEGITKISQDLTKRGAHLGLSGQITKCTAEIGGLKKTAILNPSCELQLKQAGANTFTGGVTSLCTITRGACVASLPAGNPNAELREVQAVNITGGQEDIFSVTEVTLQVNKACEELGIVGNKEGSFKAKGIAHSEKVV